MKKCICCSTESEASAVACANCGEGSWSASSIVEAKESNFASTISEIVSPPVVNDDSDTLVDVPRVRRGKRPN